MTEFDVDKPAIGCEETIFLANGYLRRFEYKPGWTWETTRRRGHPHLFIRFTAPDTRIHGQSTNVGGMWPIPRLDNKQDPEKLFFDFLHQTIYYLERHEADEWFRVDGDLMFDPHQGENFP